MTVKDRNSISVSVIMPVRLGSNPDWLIDLTEFAANTLRMHTKKKFELIIAESDNGRELKDMCDKHLSCAVNSTYTDDFNAAIEVANGDYIVHTANDIIVGPEWLEALCDPFIHIPDCGASTISIGEPGAIVGSRETGRKIVEGMYGPLMMFANHWRLDPAFPNVHSDSDLIMRMYQEGLRSYRSHRSFAHHLDGVTWNMTTTPGERDKQREEANMLFRARYQDSPLWMAKMILRGGVLYGKEHDQ